MSTSRKKNHDEMPITNQLIYQLFSQVFDGSKPMSYSKLPIFTWVKALMLVSHMNAGDVISPQSTARGT